MMISICLVHSLTFSSLPRLTICVHYESCENGIYSKFVRKSANHLSHDDFHIRKYVPNWSLQISFCQKLLGIDKAICFIMILMSVGHSLSFSSLRCITSSVHEFWLPEYATDIEVIMKSWFELFPRTIEKSSFSNSHNGLNTFCLVESK